MSGETFSISILREFPEIELSIQIITFDFYNNKNLASDIWEGILDKQKAHSVKRKLSVNIVDYHNVCCIIVMYIKLSVNTLDYKTNVFDYLKADWIIGRYIGLFSSMSKEAKMDYLTQIIHFSLQ